MKTSKTPEVKSERREPPSKIKAPFCIFNSSITFSSLTYKVICKSKFALFLIIAKCPMPFNGKRRKKRAKRGKNRIALAHFSFLR